MALGTLAFILAALSISAVAGALGAVVGLGGGVIVVPALTLGLGVDIRYAIGASIVSVVATSSGAAATYVRDRIANLRIGMLLEVATTSGALAGVLLAAFISSRGLFLLFSAALFYSAVVMLRKRQEELPVGVVNDRWAARLRLSSSYPDASLGREVPYQVTGVPLGFALMFVAGIISGLLGIGSGALKVPAMDGAMRLPMKVSSATSNFMIGVTAAASAGVYYMRGDIHPLVAGPVAVGVLAGAMLGTRLMVHMPSGQIRKVFIAVLLVIASQMGLRAFGIVLR